MEKSNEELALRHQFDEAMRQALADPKRAVIARVALQMIIEGKTEGEIRAGLGSNRQAPKRDLAEERRAAVQKLFFDLSFNITVPKPTASNHDFARWEESAEPRKALFYRPPESEVSYEAFMGAVGQGGHWTVADEKARAKIGWESAAEGYWFLMEVASDCPRLKTSWNALNIAIRLPCLEEYAIAHWLCRMNLDDLDIRTACWLRTVFGSGMLSVDGARNKITVIVREDEGQLSKSYGGEGGRAVETIANAA